MTSKPLSELIIGIKGAGEMGSGIAWRLFMANMRRILMMDISNPLAVRRGVSFCEAIQEDSITIEGLEAVRAKSIEDIRKIWDAGKIPVLADPEWRIIKDIRPDVMLDAILAKKNLGTSKDQADLVIGLGPGFTAGKDVHIVIETNRGHNLGQVITSGQAQADTGIPGAIAGHTVRRVLRAPGSGIFHPEKNIGDSVTTGERIGTVGGTEVQAGLDGVIRGLIRSGTLVNKGLKIGDIDPRGDTDYCYTISDKARAIGGAVLEAILRIYNRPVPS